MSFQGGVVKHPKSQEIELLINRLENEVFTRYGFVEKDLEISFDDGALIIEGLRLFVSGSSNTDVYNFGPKVIAKINLAMNDAIPIEPPTYDLYLSKANRAFSVFREVYIFTGIGLQRSNEIVDACIVTKEPQLLQRNVPAKVAQQVQKTFADIGCEVVALRAD